VDLDTYIGRHRAEWSRLEHATAGGGRRSKSRSGTDISELVRLYLRASSHLAEVQTRYHDPALEDYLNALVGRAHATIYSTEARTLGSMAATFGERYRRALRRTGPFILVVAALLGILILAMDLWVAASPEARAGLLPPAAEEAIRRSGGETPLADEPAAALSTFILQNNVQVAFLSFALGITLGAGTIYVIVQNGVFLGLLAGGFQAAGKAASFWALVLPHGFLELIAICIAAGSGLRMGWALVEPGDRPRITALGEEARDAVLVVVGVIPAFIIAATIEGFVTGRTGAPVLEVALGAVVAVAYLAFLFAPRRRRSAHGAVPPRGARAP
jgi:uncharacterized membrane protein SpoIIM required for sporulation